ncbi:MAG: hypothetical protein ACYTHJ_10525 [Planctomycetota bacterium]|jgi:hypothetical protein
MGQFPQGIITLFLLLGAGSCVADIPTGEELFEQMNSADLIAETTGE